VPAPWRTGANILTSPDPPLGLPPRLIWEVSLNGPARGVKPSRGAFDPRLVSDWLPIQPMRDLNEQYLSTAWFYLPSIVLTKQPWVTSAGT
jgi:hypothetical protein